MDEDADLNLTIPVTAIFDEFLCPICFNLFTNTHMTPCGHNFCEECILECLNRKHQCPCCNKETTKEQLVKNHHFDKLAAIVSQEKEDASKNYFTNLLRRSKENQGGGQSGGAEGGSKPAKTLSPIEQLFHQHMKRSLAAYEEYYQDLKKKHDKMEEKIKEDAVAQMNKVRAKMEDKIRQKPNTKTEQRKKADKRIARITSKCDKKIAELGASFQQSTAMLIDTYDKYLRDNMPVPSFLPVKVTVVLPEKGIRLENVTLKPTDTLADLRPMVEARVADRGDPVVDWGSDVQYILKTMDGEERSLIDENMPVGNYNMQTGSELILIGRIVLKSDQPQECFTANFKKDAGMACNYYTCKTCNFNWICEPCAKTCHKGHDIVDYIRNHKPTWSCCYCVKNKKCVIPNSKTKK